MTIGGPFDAIGFLAFQPNEAKPMTASVTILKPRKPKRLKTASITYPPELLPVPDFGVEVDVIIKCNRPDCIGEVCPYCEADTGKLLTEIFKAQQKLYGPKGRIVKFQAKKGKGK